MENLSWGLPPPAYGFGHQRNRSRYGSNLDIRDTCPVSTQQNLLPRRQRSPSLPPISHYQQEQNTFESVDGAKYLSKQNAEHENNAKYRYEDVEGETSGYASDCIPQSSPEFWANKQKFDNGNTNNDINNNNNSNERVIGNQSSNHFTDSRGHLPMTAWQINSSQDRWSKEKINEEPRPRWGDRGVAAGRLWEPREAGARLPQVSAKGTPSWVERSLNMIDNGDSQILVIDQQSESSKIDMTDYRNMSENHSDRNTYLLGQNTPIEPTIKAEREFRRLKALELQAAIVQQLEDRERQKKEEKERRLREEKEEEERFRKQQELERQRLDEERRVIEEKQKREQRRAEALRIALEKAEQQAKLDKENKKNRRLKESFDAMSINSELDLKSMDRSPRKEQNQHLIAANGESKLIQNIYIEQTFSPRRKIVQEQVNKAYGCQGGTENSIIMPNTHSARFHHQNDSDTNEHAIKKTDMPRQNQTDPLNAVYHGSQPGSLLADTSLSLVQIPIASELIAPVSFNHNNGVQMALLVPPNGIYPCVQPISMQALFSTDTNSLHRNSYNVFSQTDTDDTLSNKDMSDKILTPSKYRKYKDASTQTEIESISLKSIGIVEEKSKRRSKSNENDTFNNLEQNTSEEKLNSLTIKKEKRHQSEERLANKELENRPKWGVNKPPTQYKKQSEKDIFYTQKRKLRLRKRIQEKNYTSHSSDDNRSPSPVPATIKSSNEKNRVSLTDYHWRKKSEKLEKIPYPKNLVIETTQITPLECDTNGMVHLGDNFSITSKRTYVQKKAEPSKNLISLSQKFMNDKYGNPKLWPNDKQDNISFDMNGIDNKIRDVDNKFKDRIENRKKLNDNINKSKKEQSQYYKEQEEQPLVLDQLRSLRESLKKQQQIWGKFDDLRRSPSPKNEVDIEMD